VATSVLSVRRRVVFDNVFNQTVEGDVFIIRLFVITDCGPLRVRVVADFRFCDSGIQDVSILPSPS
jgi:hypothetical protein